jgi:hypothetical protein
MAIVAYRSSLACAVVAMENESGMGGAWRRDLGDGIRCVPPSVILCLFEYFSLRGKS